VRVLGRKGTLVLNAVSDAKQLSDVASGAKLVLAKTEFTVGNRYSDFNPSLDKVAAYGIGGLIAGKILLKAGLFKLLLKPLIVGGLVLVGLVKKMFGAKAA
jgi:uncharacterized membrane-anchored protein